jgi:hypothetical protein
LRFGREFLVGVDLCGDCRHGVIMV